MKFRNLSDIPTWKLSEIVNSHHGTGVDGADYGPVIEEIQGIYWQRLNTQAEQSEKEWAKKFNDKFQYDNGINKKPRSKRATQGVI